MIERLNIPYWSSCWASLFPRTPCAVDFAAKDRPSFTKMKGLELTFELLCVVCGLRCEDVDNGGLLLLGPRALVYPVLKEDDCVQWHFQPLDKESSSHFLLPENRLYTDDLDALRGAKRHFLGLWNDPVVTLGTELQKCTQVNWSQARQIERETTHQGYSVGVSFSLPKLLGFKLDHNFVFGKSRIPQVSF